MEYIFRVTDEEGSFDISINASTTDEAWGLFNFRYSPEDECSVVLTNGYQGKHMKVLRYGKEEK